MLQRNSCINIDACLDVSILGRTRVLLEQNLHLHYQSDDPPHEIYTIYDSRLREGYILFPSLPSQSNVMYKYKSDVLKQDPQLQTLDAMHISAEVKG